MQKVYQCRRVRLKETLNQKDLMILSNPEHFSLVFVLSFLVHGLNKCNQILVTVEVPSLLCFKTIVTQYSFLLAEKHTKCYQCAVMNLCSNFNPFNYSNSGASYITNVECPNRGWVLQTIHQGIFSSLYKILLMLSPSFTRLGDCFFPFKPSSGNLAQ